MPTPSRPDRPAPAPAPRPRRWRPARLAWLAALVAVAAVGACSSKKSSTPEPGPTNGDDARAAPARDASAPPGGVVLPAAPRVPDPPAGLPPRPAAAAVTAEEVALGRLLFHDPRLASDRRTACATCHEPARGFAGTEPRSTTASGQSNLRHTPTLLDLAWHTELGWDGRASDPIAFVVAHVQGQQGRPLAAGVDLLMTSPTYAAHVARSARGRDPTATAAAALWAYASTRYSGDAAWDAHERGQASAVVTAAETGYRLFNGKAQCATCHAPPLYTDLGYHRLGLIASPDEGRGLVDPTLAGAFKTPTLRGLTGRHPLFHDGSAADLEAAVDWHLAGGRGQGADPSVIDPGLAGVTVTPDERAALIAFVRSLSPSPSVAEVPTLPGDVSAPAAGATP